jgi:hypothetical protein
MKPTCMEDGNMLHVGHAAAYAAASLKPIIIGSGTRILD